MRLLGYNPNLTPYDEFDAFFDRAFGSLSRLPFGSLGETDRYRLAADVYEDDEAFHILVELPGVRKEDTSVTMENNVLTIAAERKDKGEGEERSLSYRRSLTIPEGVDNENVKASLENGILTVTLPKGESQKSRQIEIA
jgi:HSP20 family protein